MKECVYMRQSRDRKQRKAGIIFCRHYNDKKGILADCENCKKRIDPKKYLR